MYQTILSVRACLRGVDLFLFGGGLCCFCLRSVQFPTVSDHVCVAECFLCCSLLLILSVVLSVF